MDGGYGLWPLYWLHSAHFKYSKAGRVGVLFAQWVLRRQCKAAAIHLNREYGLRFRLALFFLGD